MCLLVPSPSSSSSPLPLLLTQRCYKLSVKFNIHLRSKCKVKVCVPSQQCFAINSEITTDSSHVLETKVLNDDVIKQINVQYPLYKKERRKGKK
uniref:Uncharacterized protein n=1 Tax=Glossina brevipalpis TaxID=37001 RepID=A0A1A9WTR9_9MUSC